MSRLCLGSMYFGGVTPRDEAVRIVAAALDAGISFFDTSDMYNAGRSEEVLGDALRELRARDRVVLATKVFYATGDGPNERGAGRAHIVRELELQLRRLGTEWIDLYYLHRPDFDTPLEETVQTLDGLVRSGKIRHWGVSTFPAWRTAEAWWRAERRGWVHPIAEQSPYNLLDRRLENERVPFLRRYGMGLMTWSSLAGGLLSGKYEAAAVDAPPPGTRLFDQKERYRPRLGTSALAKAQEIGALAREAGIGPIQLAIAWLQHQPVVTATVIGPRTSEQLAPYLEALEVTIGPDLLAAIDRAVPPGSAYADFHDTSGWFVGPLTQVAPS
ncbi:MAG: aldo/keto reductase [Actinobacteria bacterium]|nr:aldo/keto reductase [Actinomycetota bacterium]